MTTIKKHHEISAATKIIVDWRSMAVVHAIFEQGPMRYRELDCSLGFSPTVLSQKLSSLVDLGVVERVQKSGSKEVIYKTKQVAADMTEAYHLLEGIDNQLGNKGVIV